MLNNINYKFEFKENNYFDKEISKIKLDGQSYIEAIIVYFYKENNLIKKFIRYEDTDISDINIDTFDIITKYYITKYCIGGDAFGRDSEYNTFIKIYNIGDFEVITDGYISPKEEQYSTKLFEKYDNNFKKLEIPFSDEEFLKKNTQILGLDYEGKIIR